MYDAKAVKILIDHYWHKGGLRHPRLVGTPLPATEDFEYAKKHGVMFDPRRLTNTRVQKWCEDGVKGLMARDVGRAFVASLTSRRLDLRSGLSSFAVARSLPKHACPVDVDDLYCCAICGCSELEEQSPENLNDLCFERFKWGGVSHMDPLYAALDLEMFRSRPRPEPTDEDWKALGQLLGRLDGLAAGATATVAVKAIAKCFPSTLEERRAVLEILATAGVLESKKCPSFRTRFIDERTREQARSLRSDWDYPMIGWRGSDGVSIEGVKEWFGEEGLRAWKVAKVHRPTSKVKKQPNRARKRPAS